MTLLHPFCAWRPRSDLVQRVAAPPYDVLNSEEARAMASGLPESFLRVSKAEIGLEPGIPVHDERVYALARECFTAFCRDGILHQDAHPWYYIYRLTMQGREQTGIAGVASVAAYLEGRIKKHEFTRPDKENDRTRLADTLNAHAGPVFLTHRHDVAIKGVIESWIPHHPPVYDFVAGDQVRHTLWVVDQSAAISALQEAFKRLPALYIADGHHRAAAASRVHLARRQHDPNPNAPHARFLAVAFSDTQVRIMDYNRVVRDLNGLDEQAFLDRIAALPRLTLAPAVQPVRPAARHEFGMYLKGRWFRLKVALEPHLESDPVQRLDVTILQERLLHPVLGIADPRQDQRIDFVGGMRGLEALVQRVDSGEMAVAFSMYPTALEELMAVADSGQVMPPKSTWFEPKLRDGLLVQML
ncbi:MAG: DUF1015 domain-containing protein [Magnetococcales bacterium]|nr:DUF1015 domain-containing protein [Magnetococcales bacterium]NGZ06242.1 DUF1015 domain-containing protein [Magnetococcales bacterium]